MFFSPALAQVNGPGPSPSGDFDVVLNLPGDEAVVTGVSGESIGGVVGQVSQLNVNVGGVVGREFSANFGSEVNFNGGRLGFRFDANSGSEVNIGNGTEGGGAFDAFSGSVVNISGGTVGRDFNALTGSEVNISGGIVAERFDAESGSAVSISGGSIGPIFDALSGSEVTISGGAIGYNFTAHSGSDVELIGGEFRLNGASFSGGTISLTEDDIFTGTFADGSSFVFVESQGGNFLGDDLNDVTLTVVGLPPIDTTPTVLSTPLLGPSGLRIGQALTVVTGGSIADSFSLVDATLNVEGGTVGEGVQAFNSSVDISGGIVGGFFDALTGSEVNISGGIVGDRFDAFEGSVVNISGGTVGFSFGAFAGSEVNISGGTMAENFDALPGSDVELIGGEFRLNGTNFTGGTISIAGDDVFTGTLADGSSFIFGLGDDLNDVTLSVVGLPPIDAKPTVLNAPVSNGPAGLRAGQELTVVAGGALLRDNFSVVDATLNVQGGSLGGRTEIYNSVVNISGGAVGRRFTVFSGSEVNISGGDVEGGFISHASSVVNISGGTVGFLFEALAGSVVNISGGIVGDRFNARAGSVVNISGSEFSIDGTLLNQLQFGQPFTITDRDVALSGILADGEPFSFDLNSVDNFRGVFSPDATITVTLEAPFVLGDFDRNGLVNIVDLDMYNGNIGAEAVGALALLDLNQDGTVGADDFELHYSSLVETSNGQRGTFAGDANLDGTVDVLNDAFALVSNLGQSVMSFADGDFDADGVVDVLGDAFLLVGNLGMTNENLQ
jgi:hypothetical protein